MANIYIKGSLPDGMIEDFLQYFRDYEHEREQEMLMEIIVNIPNGNENEMKKIFDSVNPPIPYKGKVRWAEKEQSMEWRSE